MADKTEAENKNDTLFNKLKKLFSSGVIVRNVGGKSLKISDTDGLQYATDRNSLRDRYNRLRSSTYNLHNRDMSLAYQAARLELFRDYDTMDSDAILASALDIYADECVSENTLIPLLDGRKISIGELYKTNLKNFWVYSIDETGKFSPQLCERVAYNGKKSMVKLTLCDGTEIKCTKSHIWILDDGKQEETRNLNVGSKLKIFSTKTSSDKFLNGYEMILEDGEWKYTHRLVANRYKPLIDSKNSFQSKLKVIHHSSFNKLNNSRHLQSTVGATLRNKCGVDQVKQISAKKRHSDYLAKGISVEKIKIACDGLLSSGINIYRKHNIVASSLGITVDELKDFIVICQYKGLRDMVNATNHRIISIEDCEMCDAYDLVNVENSHIYAIEANDGSKIFTHNCLVPSEFGNVLTITTENDQVKKILENLFNDILNIEFNLWSWTRNLAKYGDFFLRMEISPEYGVYLVKPLSAYEITRVEGSDPQNINYVKFQHDGLGGGQEYENFEMAHFRLISDSNFLPYGKCLKGDTYVDTEFGTTQIKDIKVGDSVWTFNSTTNKMELSTVLNQVSSGIKEIIRIRTQHNFVDCSREHPILTYNKMIGKTEYKVANEIKIGDLLIISSNNNKQSREHKIDKTVSEDLTCKSFLPIIDKIPDYVDEEFAEFFGFMLGDGWIKKYSNGARVCFSLGTDEVQNTKYITALEKYSGKPVRVTKVGDPIGKSRSAIVYTKRLYEILKNMGFGENAKTKRIPNWVFESTESIRLALLDGFYNADGWEFTDKWAKHCAVELCNKDLVFDVKRLIQLSNIKSSIPSSHIYNDIVEICGATCNRSENHSIYYYPEGQIKQQMLKYDFIDSDDIFIEPVRKIEYQPDAETFDIQVASDNSNFIANGIIVHNSMLEPARRIWKQLSLMEDAMLIHRIVRAPEKRIFKVDVGNIPPAEVDAYMEKLMNKAKKVPYIDERTGDYNLRYNLNNMLEDFWLPVRGGDSGTSIDTLSGMEFTGIEDIEYLRNKMMAALKIPKAFLGYDETLCLALDTKIPLLNGIDKSISELISDHNNGIKNYVYSIDENTKRIVPGEITWAGITKKNTKTVKVWLDNGEYIQSTPDHLFLTRDGRWIEAEKLEVNQSLMPLYKKYEIMYKKSDYEKIYNPETDDWKWTHQLINSHNFSSTKEKGTVIHHVDFNRKNNNPTNLTRMTWTEHRDIHTQNVYKTLCSPEANLYKKSKEFSDKKSSERLNYIKNNPSEISRLKNNLAQYSLTSEELSAACKDGWKNSKSVRFDKLSETNKKYNKQSIAQKAARFSRGFLSPLPSLDEIKNFINVTKFDTLSTVSRGLKCSNTYIKRLITRNGYSSIHEIFNEMLGFRSGCPANVNSEFYMKLITKFGSAENVISTYNLSKNQIETFKKSKPLNHKVVKIEYCEELIDTGDITVDVYHNFATSAGVIVHNSGKSTLASEDVRFSRTIGRMQRIIVSELSKIAVVHLFVQGYKDASLVDFDLKLSNPSTVFEQEKIAIWQDKVNLAKDMMESNSFSRKWLYTKLWGLTGEEAEEIHVDVISDKKEEWRLKQITTEGNDPMTSKQKVGSDGELSDADSSGNMPDLGGSDGESSDIDSLGNIPDLGGSDSEPPIGGDSESLSGLTEAEEPKEDEPTRQEKDERNRKRDQTGEKDSTDYPFGEDPLGTQETFREKSHRTPNRTTNPRPLRVTERANSLSMSSMSEEIKSIKQTLRARNLIKNQKSVISETKSMLDESNLISDE